VENVFLLANSASNRASELHAVSRLKSDIVFTRSSVYFRTILDLNVDP
jgi:hypothetical protein